MRELTRMWARRRRAGLGSMGRYMAREPTPVTDVSPTLCLRYDTNTRAWESDRGTNSHRAQPAGP